MKKTLILLATMAIAVAASAQSKDQPYLTKTFKVSEIKNVKTSTVGGSLWVTGDAATEAKVEVFITPNNGRDKDLTAEEIKARLDEYYDINISMNGNELKAVATSKANMNWKKTLSISFRLSVPREVATDLSTSGGSIHLSGLTGDQNFRTSGGSLHLDALNGNISGKTSGGSIHISQSKGVIDLKTSGGSIEATNCDGTLDLTTSGGSLTLEHLKGDIKARTSGGSIKGGTISGELLSHTSGGSIKLNDLSCSLDASTSAGSVDASFIEPGKYVKVAAVAGSATVELPKSKGYTFNLSGNRVTTGTLSNFNGSVEKNQVKGTLNGGGSDVYVHTSVGSVTIEWK